MRFTVDRLDHVVLNCDDTEIIAAWYQRVLGMEREDYAEGRRVALKFGGQNLNLRPRDAIDADWLTGRAAAPGGAAMCFVTAVRPDDIIRHLHECFVTIEDGPVPREGALGAMVSVYCRDPEGNLVELASYFGD